jgi:NAD(P) transhydrogenase subunit beta
MSGIDLLIQFAYLVSVALFIFGLKRMSTPRTARSGNAYASLAMLLAVGITLFNQEIVSFTQIIIGLAIGGIIGIILAVKIEMTAMPQLVALFNGFGGLASALVGLSEYLGTTAWAKQKANAEQLKEVPDSVATFLGPLLGDLANISLPVEALAASTGLSILIGAITFTGSLVAFGKLQGLKITPSAPVTFPGRLVVNGLLLLLTIFLVYSFAADPTGWKMALLIIVSLALGILLVLPIGGADMPVVVSLLNSYSGLAACATGFVLQNQLLIVAGALVGASGLILTQIMCVAMNRSLMNVLVGGFGAVAGGGAKAGEQRTVANYDAVDAAAVLDIAQSVIIVPGYGLAVAQAQHAVRELQELLEENGAQVRYAIHPVAGRMPGHMNVLLAEADVPYDKLVTMEDINPEFESTDVAIVLGANDVTNPAARDDASSPIYGMPILEVDKAGTVMIVKRSLSPGYAGIDNELFYDQKTMMLFGDAKKMVGEMIQALKEA